MLIGGPGWRAVFDNPAPLFYPSENAIAKGVGLERDNCILPPGVDTSTPACLSAVCKHRVHKHFIINTCAHNKSQRAVLEAVYCQAEA